MIDEYGEIAMVTTGDVSTRVPGVDAADPIALEYRNAFSRALDSPEGN